MIGCSSERNPSSVIKECQQYCWIHPQSRRKTKSVHNDRQGLARLASGYTARQPGTYQTIFCPPLCKGQKMAGYPREGPELPEALPQESQHGTPDDPDSPRKSLPGPPQLNPQVKIKSPRPHQKKKKEKKAQDPKQNHPMRASPYNYKLAHYLQNPIGPSLLWALAISTALPSRSMLCETC